MLASIASRPSSGRLSHVYFKRNALAAINPHGQLDTWNVQAYEGQALKIRIRVDTDYATTNSSRVLLYDGKPASGGKLIANVLAFTGDPAGNYAWVEWAPTDLGPHRLYAKVVQSILDTKPGIKNISGILRVEVIKAPQGKNK